MKLILIAILSVFQLASCSNTPKHQNITTNLEPVQEERTDGFKTAYFASGCFWCVEAIFESVIGVQEAISGYAGGSTKKPTYRQVGGGSTGHAEVVKVVYNPNKVNFKTLLKVYYGSQNPTTYGQAPDFGAAYRSIIFYQNEIEKQEIEVFKAEIQKKYTSKKVRTEIMPFQVFWRAEGYHQDFEKRNPNYPYVVSVSKPRLEHFKEKFPELIKK